TREPQDGFPNRRKPSQRNDLPQQNTNPRSERKLGSKQLNYALNFLVEHPIPHEDYVSSHAMT
ncbi:MAG TPA: hypothetical protein VKB04_08945, partial [Anaerolineales bacterium]|nr:hypothetical protein [Anaerolineales bacterium]